MEYDTKYLKKLLGVTAGNIGSYRRALQIFPKIETKPCKRCIYSKEQVACIINYYNIRQKYPELSFNQLLNMQDQLIAEGFKPILYEDTNNNSSLVKDKRFFNTSFFPSTEEITPFQFMEV